jgi:transcriptional regulator with XRE-family HTH domain
MLYYKRRWIMNLRELRKELGLTQTECAIKCEVSLMTWQNWERGVTTPSPDNMVKIKNLFEVV